MTAATLLLATASLVALGVWSYRSIGRARDLAEYRRSEATAVAYRALLGETRASPFSPDSGLARPAAKTSSAWRPWRRPGAI